MAETKSTKASIVEVKGLDDLIKELRELKEEVRNLAEIIQWK